MRMVARLNKVSAEALMRLCGRDGVLTGKYIETEEDKLAFATVPLDCSREKALERAAFHGAECWGVVPQRNGLSGNRVLREQYERLAKLFRPDDYQKITGETYEISGCPTYMDEDGLAEFLAPETVVVQFNGTTTKGKKEQARRSFFVKTANKVTCTYKHGEDFFATCKSQRDGRNAPSPKCTREQHRQDV